MYFLDEFSNDEGGGKNQGKYVHEKDYSFTHILTSKTNASAFYIISNRY